MWKQWYTYTHTDNFMYFPAAHNTDNIVLISVLDSGTEVP